MTEYGARLLPQHQAMLAASGIPPEHARARGYISIDSGNRKRLKYIGIVKAVQKSDGLLIPLLRIDGEIGGYQFRPDNPRVKDGKEIKYETPFRQSNMIDFPPGVTERLADRNTPIWITEGVKKADAGFCAGLAIVGLTGVWNWLRPGDDLVLRLRLRGQARRVEGGQGPGRVAQDQQACRRQVLLPPTG